jgi:ribose transport system ATP-binding protein
VTTAVLSTSNLAKRYPGVVALDDVSVEIRPHEVVGLVGENGAGKSTLLKVLAGVIPPDGGHILLRGREIRFHGVAEARRAGIGMVFQEQSLLPTISVGENILLGAEGPARWHGVYRWGRLDTLAREQLAKVDSTIDPRTRTDSLGFAERQMVELAKALAIEETTRSEPIILLDEPTSVLEAAEIATLFRQIERLRATTSIVFVSHRLDEVLRVADRIYVLRGGRVVAEAPRAEVEATDLYRLMVGDEAQDGHFHEELYRPPDMGRVRAEGQGLAHDSAFRDITFGVHAGEVLGLAGVQGSGREALCRALFGAEPLAGGEFRLDGVALGLRSPVDAVRAGIAYVPAERRSEGVFAGMSVAGNMTIAHTSSVRRGPFLDPARESRLTRSWIERLHIKARSPAASVQTLSGGTQQKVVLARWMIGPAARLMILDHPTRGLDVGAKSEVYAIVRQLAATGMAIVLMADTLEETIALSDRVMVLKDGQSVATFEAPPGDKPSPVAIVERMV